MFGRSLHRSILIICMTVTVGMANAPCGKAQQVFQAGAAQVDITPREPVPMWGYGDRHAKLSEGSMDPLMATAVVIQAGKNKMAIVGLDIGRSPVEDSLQRIREQISAQASIDVSFIGGSHTHNGPVVELSDRPGRGRGRFDASIRYSEELEQGIIKAVLAADANRTDTFLATGSVTLDNFNRNRHSKIEPVPCDRLLSLMRLTRSDNGNSIATIVNFTAHPTSIPSESLQFSSDYVGAMRGVIEKELGGQAIFMQGASGDISTNRGPHGDHVAYGQALGRAVVKLANELTPEKVISPSLKIREERFQFDSRTDFRNPIVQGVYSVAFFPELVANFVDEYSDGIRPRLTVALLNQEIALVGVSGEFFCQHAIRLRERTRTKSLFFFGYCNGYHQYFPTIEGAAEGGYGADEQVAPAQVGAGETMMNAALAWIFQMQGKLARKQSENAGK
jgi:neutral ceramidase